MSDDKGRTRDEQGFTHGVAQQLVSELEAKAAARGLDAEARAAVIAFVDLDADWNSVSAMMAPGPNA